MTEHSCEVIIEQSPPGQGGSPRSGGPGMTEHSCEVIIEQSPPGQGGSPRSGDPA
jgi:hypothetical protein